MPFLVRKIEYSKWDQRKILDGEEPSGDAITNCMKTKQNKLSVWHIDDESERNEAVLAIVANLDHVEAIDILLIDESLISEAGLSLQEVTGETPYHAFENNHLNVSNLDYSSLGTMAKATVESIRQNRHKRFREKELIDILTNAIQLGKVQLSELGPDVQKKISRS